MKPFMQSQPPPDDLHETRFLNAQSAGSTPAELGKGEMCALPRSAFRARPMFLEKSSVGRWGLFRSTRVAILGFDHSSVLGFPIAESESGLVSLVGFTWGSSEPLTFLQLDDS